MDYLLAISIVMHNHWWVWCIGNEKFYILLWHDIDRQAHIWCRTSGLVSYSLHGAESLLRS
jgi:hypothetical protein